MSETIRFDNWNRCDECGKFIAFDDFSNGLATRVLLTPDSEYTSEKYERLSQYTEGTA